MDYVYGIVGFVILMGALAWYENGKRARQLHRDEMNTMTVKELVAKLRKLDPNEKIVVDIKYADYDLRARDLDDPHDDFGDSTNTVV